VKIPGRQDPKANLYKLVYDWLQDERKEKWVLILDNVDDDRFLHEAPSISQDGSGRDNNRTLGQPLFAYLPLSSRGSVIMTTRSKGVASRMVEERDVIAVEPMDKIHARTLFEKKLGMPENQEDIMELTAALEFMPLTIVQAAAYIKQRAPRSSVKQYLEKFRQSDREKMSLLDHEGGQLRRDREAKNSIILTWQISFDHIRQMRPTAADLLSLMSFFDRQGIVECLLRDQSNSGNNHGNAEESWEDDDGLEDEDSWGDETSDNDENSTLESDVNNPFESDIIVLRNFSFISVNMDGASFEMHRLVQLAMQKWLKAYGRLEQWKQRFIRNLSREFPTGEYENWERCKLIFPHAQSAMAQRPDADDSLGEWASLLYNAAWFAWRKGNVIEAEEMAVKAMKARKKVLGPEHESTLSSIDMVGSAFDSQGKYKEAEAMHQWALAGKEKVLGVNHPNTLASISYLGRVLTSQGKYNEAEAMYQRALAGYKKVLGVDHPYTLTSINNLGRVLDSQGKYKEAEAMHQWALAGKEKVLGVDHPNTLASINNLGRVLDSQGKYKEAEAMHQRALAGSEKVLGVDHPDTLISMWNLSHTWKKQGRDDEALELLKTCIQLQHQKLGPCHPHTVSAMANLDDWQVSGRDPSSFRDPPIVPHTLTER
jgi:tetratricopeptide (TPR) repeat protein